VDAEGAMPVTVITREELETSGATSVSEVLRNVTFSAVGNFRPVSGSSAQSVAEIDLKGLGGGRTLVLVDGRRLPKAPSTATAADINTIPLGAVERIEILTDGASAIYGSDAMAGVVNIITRKDFEGIQFSGGYTDPSLAGGERREGSVIFGTSGKIGRIVAGMSYNSREAVFDRDRVWGSIKGSSVYSNNYYTPTKGYFAVPNGCTDNDFRILPNGRCGFDFNSRSAIDASVENTSLFAKGEFKINQDWSIYANASVSRVQSFGRYAPVPGVDGKGNPITIAAGSPNNIAAQVDPANLGKEVYLFHRFEAAGNRDNTVDNNVYDLLLGTQGSVGKVAIDAGGRWTDSQFSNIGRNYIVLPLAEQFINSGAYNIFKPSTNSPDVLNAIKTTTSRNSYFQIAEIYGTATVPIFKMAGGDAQLLVGADRRIEKYQDQYDSLSEAGVVLGSSGNSAGGGRGVGAMYTEAVLPVSKDLEASLAARREDYADYGSNTVPKATLRWKIQRNLMLRASLGKGFAAPSLDKLTSKDSYSAEDVYDPRTYIAFGGDPARASNDQVQASTIIKANPSLKAETSRNASFGAVWDVSDNFSLRADYWKIDINNRIAYISAQDIIDRSNGDDPRPIPAGLSISRRPTDGSISLITAGYANEGNIETRGIDLTARAAYKIAGMQINHRLLASKTQSYTVDGSESVGALGFPELRANLATRLGINPKLSMFWYANHIGANGPEDTARRMRARTTHDVQLIWDTPMKGGRVSVGVVNLTGYSPRGADLITYQNRPYNMYLYDSYGRQPYVRFTQRF
jgi:iron complex outermembrane receptor protein